MELIIGRWEWLVGKEVWFIIAKFITNTCSILFCQADVFSYGIVLAEIISRLPADPDFIPRLHVCL